MSFDTREVESLVKDHIESQPEKITCSVCGSELDCSVSVDGWLDMHIEVDPCKCAKEVA